MSLERRPFSQSNPSVEFLSTLQAASRRAIHRYSDPPEGPSFMELLGTAVETGSIEAVQELISQSDNPERDIRQALGAAIRLENLDMISWLLTHGGAVDDSALSAATTAKSLPVFQLLREHGWNVNNTFRCGLVVLPGVLENESLARWLLDQGANPNLGHFRFRNDSTRDPTDPDPNSGQALDEAARLCNRALFDLLLERGARREVAVPLHMAAGSRDGAEAIQMMEHLLVMGFDINARDDIGVWYSVGTPLHWAIRKWNLENIRFLLQNGADPRKENKWGLSAITQARETENEELIGLFPRDIL